jgi:predicted dehydrogenase
VSASPLRIGVIGLGMISRAHLAGYAAADGAEIVAVCDVDAAKVEAVASAHGTQGCTDYRSLLADPEVDAVDLLLPHALHFPIAKEALEAGKHVCLEKPLTVHESEARELVDLAASRGLVLALAENTRFVHAYVVAERMLRAGELGEIRMVRGFIPDQILDEWAEDPTGWKPSAHGAGAIMDCAPHLLYQLVWYFGEVEMLHAIAQRYAPDVELENHGIIAGRVAGGALFSVELSSVTEYPRGERVEIYGSEATLIIDQVLNPPMVLYRGDSDHHGTAIAEVPYDLAQWKARSIAVEVADFVDAAREGRPAAIDLEDAIYTVRLVEAAYESVASGLPVDVRRRRGV